MLKSDLQQMLLNAEETTQIKQTRIDKLQSRSESIRKEFARAFNWQEVGYSYTDTKYKTPTWEEIFVEVGKLLATRNHVELEEQVKHLGQVVSNLESQISMEE